MAKCPPNLQVFQTIKVIRVGHGYDLHRLEPLAPAGQGKPFVLGGIYIDHDRGPVGHSDGDALLHAITDAILGALALPDIGQRAFLACSFDFDAGEKISNFKFGRHCDLRATKDWARERQNQISPGATSRLRRKPDQCQGQDPRTCRCGRRRSCN